MGKQSLNKETSKAVVGCMVQVIADGKLSFTELQIQIKIMASLTGNDGAGPQKTLCSLSCCKEGFGTEDSQLIRVGWHFWHHMHSLGPQFPKFGNRFKQVTYVKTVVLWVHQRWADGQIDGIIGSSGSLNSTREKDVGSEGTPWEQLSFCPPWSCHMDNFSNWF